MLTEFRCVNIIFCKTVIIFLRECQNIYGSDTISTTMIFVTKSEVNFQTKNDYHCAKVVRNRYSVKKIQKFFFFNQITINQSQRAQISFYSNNLKFTFTTKKDKNRLYIFLHQPNSMGVFPILANLFTKIYGAKLIFLMYCCAYCGRQGYNVLKTKLPHYL